MKTLKKGNKNFQITEKKWSNGNPVLRFLSESTPDEPGFYEEETYKCPSTGLLMTLSGEIAEINN